MSCARYNWRAILIPMAGQWSAVEFYSIFWCRRDFGEAEVGCRTLMKDSIKHNSRLLGSFDVDCREDGFCMIITLNDNLTSCCWHSFLALDSCDTKPQVTFLRWQSFRSPSTWSDFCPLWCKFLSLSPPSHDRKCWRNGNFSPVKDLEKPQKRRQKGTYQAS